MPITVNCKDCRKQYQVKDDLAGKRIRCPQCREIISVPGGKRGDEIEDAELLPRDDDRFEPDLPAVNRPRHKKSRSMECSDGMGIPRWMWFGLGGTLAILVLVGLAFYQPMFALILATLLLIVGLGMSCVGNIGCLVKAFEEDVTCGLLFLLLPIYGLCYIATRWQGLHPFSGLFAAGGGIGVLGVFFLLIGISSSLSKMPIADTSNQPSNNVDPPARKKHMQLEMKPRNSPSFPRNEPVAPTNLPNLPGTGFGAESSDPPTSSVQNNPGNNSGGSQPMGSPNSLSSGNPKRDTRPQVQMTAAQASAKGAPAPASYKFSKGEVVYVEWGAVWYEAEVLEVTDSGEPNIHWIGWSSTFDEVVQKNRVRIPKK